MKADYKEGSLSLTGAVAMGTGVMIGAGIFALTGQIAQLAGPLFPFIFLIAAVISGFSAYSYIKVSNKYPSAGGIAMILHKAYGQTFVTGGAALLMAFSMIINEALVARTFASYTMQLFGGESGGLMIPLLAVGLIFLAFLVNIAGSSIVGKVSTVSAAIKIGGILVFAIVALWASGLTFEAFSPNAAEAASQGEMGGGSGSVMETGTTGAFIAALALGILAFKGFTTITNSGGEVRNPNRNVGRAIIISLAICLVVYLAVALAVGSALSIPEIIAARDYSLAEASRPAFGELGVTFTVVIAIIATASGVLASIFAVSRMLTMLTEMKLIPHRHFGLPGNNLQKHLLVYTVVLASILAALFDLTRIAALGAIFYLLMDIIIHWGVYRHLRRDIGASGWIPLTAIVLDTVVLGAFAWLKASSDPLILWVALGGIAATFALERMYLARIRDEDIQPATHEMAGH